MASCNTLAFFFHFFLADEPVLEEGSSMGYYKFGNMEYFVSCVYKKTSSGGSSSLVSKIAFRNGNSACSTRGMYFCKPDSEVKRNTVQSMLDQSYTDWLTNKIFWIAAICYTNATCMWNEDGTMANVDTVTNYGTDPQSCVAVDRGNNFQWITNQCDASNCYICERNVTDST